MKKAKIFGHPERAEVQTAENLLRENGYHQVCLIPMEGPLEIECFPTENRGDARRLIGLEELGRFLNGEEFPASMWNIV